jgi:hypothetical protein
MAAHQWFVDRMDLEPAQQHAKHQRRLAQRKPHTGADPWCKAAWGKGKGVARGDGLGGKTFRIERLLLSRDL